jgi:hypothetical protein
VLEPSISSGVGIVFVRTASDHLPLVDALFPSLFGRYRDPHNPPLAVLKSPLAAIHNEPHFDEIRQSLINLGITPINAVV